MIIDIFLIIISGFLFLIHAIFAGINFIIPGQITNVITESFTVLKYFHGILNLAPILLSTTTLLSFITLWYGFKIIRWAYAHMPWVGKHKQLPTVDEQEEEQTTLV